MQDVSTITKKATELAAARFGLALTLALSLMGFALTAPAVNAQGLEALSPDQESLLPPEVVPLDPSAASKMMESQANSRAMSNSTSTGSNITPDSIPAPGLASEDVMTNELSVHRNANSFRQAAYESFQKHMQENGGAQPGPQSFPQSETRTLNNTPGTEPGAYIQNTRNSQPSPSQFMPAAPGMINHNPNQALAQTLPAQTQTLSGSVKQNPREAKGIRMSKLSHALSGVAAYGSVGATAAMTRNPQALYSLGIMGIGMTNYALRNGFRKF